MTKLGTEIDFSLRVFGLFGRNRKPKDATFILATIDGASPGIAIDELNRMTLAKLSEIKAKPGLRYGVYPVSSDLEQEPDGTGGFVVFRVTSINIGSRIPSLITGCVSENQVFTP